MKNETFIQSKFSSKQARQVASIPCPPRGSVFYGSADIPVRSLFSQSVTLRFSSCDLLVITCVTFFIMVKMSPETKQRVQVVVNALKTTFYVGFIPTVLYLGKSKGLYCMWKCVG